MSIEIMGIMVLIIAVLILLMLEALAIDVLAIGLLVLLWFTGYVTGTEAIAGFSNKAVIIVAAMFVLSHAIVKTGILVRISQQIISLENRLKWLGRTLFLIFISLFSGFINNVAAVAIFIPVTIEIAAKLKVSPSKLLIPLSYAAIYGGTLTLIGSSTNLLVSVIAEDQGVSPFGMFEFFSLGIVFLAIGTIYSITILPRLLPDRARAGSLVEKYHMAEYLTEFKIDADSPLIGSTCLKRKLNQEYDITILAVISGKRRYVSNVTRRTLKEGDILIARGGLDSFSKFHQQERVLALSDTKLSQEDLIGEDTVLLEGLIGHDSPLIGKSLVDLNFRKRYRAFILAISRQGEILKRKIAHTKLKLGDLLLLLIPTDKAELFAKRSDVILLQQLELPASFKPRSLLPLLIVPAVMLLAAFQVMDILLAALIGVFILLVSREINSEEMYGAIDWKIIVFVAAFIPFGTALVNSGAAEIIGSSIASLAGSFPEEYAPYLLLSLLYLITSLSTELISNNAAAIVLTPIALSTAHSMGVDPRPLLFAICFGASASFMTPVGYKTNLMVYGPGNYQFSDYLKAGVPLNIIFWLVASLLIPMIWPF